MTAPEPFVIIRDARFAYFAALATLDGVRGRLFATRPEDAAEAAEDLVTAALAVAVAAKRWVAESNTGGD